MRAVNDPAASRMHSGSSSKPCSANAFASQGRAKQQCIVRLTRLTPSLPSRWLKASVAVWCRAGLLLVTNLLPGQHARISVAQRSYAIL